MTGTFRDDPPLYPLKFVQKLSSMHSSRSYTNRCLHTSFSLALCICCDVVKTFWTHIYSVDKRKSLVEISSNWKLVTAFTLAQVPKKNLLHSGLTTSLFLKHTKVGHCILHTEHLSFEQRAGRQATRISSSNSLSTNKSQMLTSKFNWPCWTKTVSSNMRPVLLTLELKCLSWGFCCPMWHETIHINAVHMSTCRLNDDR